MKTETVEICINSRILKVVGKWNPLFSIIQGQVQDFIQGVGAFLKVLKKSQKKPFFDIE